MNAAELLANSLSPDQALRENATRQLETAAVENFPGYMHHLAAALADDSSPDHIRNAAGLAFKNALAARSASTQQPLSERWLSQPDDVTTPLKRSILSTIGSANARAGAVSAQCISAIAAIELPVGKGQDLIPTLLEFVQNQDSMLLRVHALQAIGYICESISPEILSERSNEILTAVVQGARKEEPSQEVQAAAINALYNSLEFIRDNFSREGERNYIMQVVCEATQAPTTTVQVGAFECLVRIMSLYYDRMEFYMERALFGLTIAGMRNPHEPVALQAIEFWSTVCEEEIELNIEAQEAQAYGDVPAVESKGFARMAIQEVLPPLLELLTSQSEDDDEDDWTRSMAAAACLQLLAKTVGDEIVQPVVSFIETGLRRSEWQYREAAVMAFGSILDGPEPTTLSPLVQQALPPLIEMLKGDPSEQVQDTVAWTLSKITEVLLEVIDTERMLDHLIAVLVGSLNGTPRIVNSCCAALGNLVQQLSTSPDILQDDLPTTPMSRFYPDILKALVPISEKSDNDSNSRTAAYQTIATYISSVAVDTLPLVQDLLVGMLARQESLMGMHNQLVGMDDHTNWNDMQINLCVVIQSAVTRSPALIAPFADRIMTNLLQLLSTAGKDAAVREDAFATIGSLATALEAGFTKYMDAFAPFLIEALGFLDDWQVAQAGVYATSDVARAIQGAIQPYATNLMVPLLSILRESRVNRQVKPNAITAIGEIALAIGAQFQPYLQTTMEMLSQAGSMTSNDPQDYVLIEFIWTMRGAIVDAFIGILNGFKETDPSAFQPYVSSIMGFLRMCFADPDRTEVFCVAAIGLIGDFGDTYKGAIKNELVGQDWVPNAIIYIRQIRGNKQARQNAAYAQRVLKEITTK